MAKKVKCRYKHCLHDDRYLDRNEAVMGGNKSYYHPDCYEEKQTIEDMIDYSINVIGNYNSRNKVTETIKEIVFTDNVPAKELFGKIKEYIKLGKKINYPSGLKYVVNDEDTIKAYRSSVNRQKIDADTSTPVLVEDTKFNYVCPKRKTILDVLV